MGGSTKVMKVGGIRKIAEPTEPMAEMSPTENTNPTTHSKSNWRSSRKSGNGRKNFRGIICYHCHQLGHKSMTCPNRDSERPAKTNIICHRCNEPGHISPECPRKAAARDNNREQQPPQQLVPTRRCRFYLQGNCRQGVSCMFLHEQPTESTELPAKSTDATRQSYNNSYHPMPEYQGYETPVNAYMMDPYSAAAQYMVPQSYVDYGYYAQQQYHRQPYPMQMGYGMPNQAGYMPGMEYQGGYSAPYVNGVHPEYTAEEEHPNQEEEEEPVEATEKQEPVGLRNEKGENSCFLNVIVQAMFHNAAFQNAIKQVKTHDCAGTDRCVFCGLKNVFESLQQDQAASSESLRTALSNAFSDQAVFSMGQMDDASEALDRILWTLHKIITDPAECSAKRACAIHQSFGLFISEQGECGTCHTKTKPFKYDTMMLYASTSVLYDALKQQTDKSSFDVVLKQSFARSTNLQCNNKKCQAPQYLPGSLQLDQEPSVVNVVMTWPNDSPSNEFLSVIWHSISTTIQLNNLFDTRSSREEGELVGLVGYHGRHYIAILYNEATQTWQSYDDAVVQSIGSNWSDVVDRYLESQFQPLILFYDVCPVEFTIGDLVVSAVPDDFTWQ